jgi:hypothetical protein
LQHHPAIPIDFTTYPLLDKIESSDVDI